MEIKYSEWAKINHDLYGVFFDKNIDCAVLFKLTNLINTNTHNLNPSFVDKIFIPRNEYNNRKDIEKFDLSQLKQKIYEIEIDKVLSKETLGKKEETNNVFICRTPKVFADIGLDENKSITMRREKIRICNLPIEEGGHGIKKEQLYSLPNLLTEPAIIMKSKTREKSVVGVLNDIDVRNMPLLVAISPDEKGFYNFESIDTNLLSSVYGRKDFEKFLNDNKEKTLFKDDNVLKDLREKINKQEEQKVDKNEVLYNKLYDMYYNNLYKNCSFAKKQMDKQLENKSLNEKINILSNKIKKYDETFDIEKLKNSLFKL